eukprot:gene5889-4206_t
MWNRQARGGLASWFNVTALGSPATKSVEAQKKEKEGNDNHNNNNPLETLRVSQEKGNQKALGSRTPPSVFYSIIGPFHDLSELVVVMESLFC